LEEESLETYNVRRVVTGLGETGRSRVIFDGVPPARLASSQSGPTAFSLWQTPGPHASNEGAEDAASKPFDLSLAFGATKFLTTWFPAAPDAAQLSPEERARWARATSNVSPAYRTPSDHPGMHMTPTVDYIVIVRGELTLVLEDGECTLRAGDVAIDRGVAHAWENRGTEPAVLVAVVVDAAPIGPGAMASAR
jgi:mannose-6-phosphate isomerase-like protein (cupin superfamily)